MPRRSGLLAAALTALAASLAAAAFDIAVPPPGGSQRSTVIQHLGLVTVSVDYSSPRVTSPTGENRRGRIWGQLVPYGLHALDFNDCTQCPWRAGANENTVFTTSHDIKVQGKQLPADKGPEHGDAAVTSERYDVRRYDLDLRIDPNDEAQTDKALAPAPRDA